MCRIDWKMSPVLCLAGPEMLHAEDTQSLCPANRKVCKDKQLLSVTFL